VTSRSDDFNRADNSSSLGTPSDGGSAWVAASGTWGIASNQARKVASEATFQMAYLEASTTTAEVQGTCTTQANNGFVARFVDTNNHIFFQFVGAVNGGPNAYIWKRVSGTYTQIGSTYTGAQNANDVWKGTVDSSNNLRLYQNGTQRVSGTDSAHSTATKYGLCFREITGRVDDFSITDTASAASIIGPLLGGHLTTPGPLVGGRLVQ
jgi:hypothetical protein